MSRNHQIRSRKLQSVCRIKATHERLMRRQTQREIITNHGAPAAQVNPEEEANIRIDAAALDFADKKRLDREARLERRKQIKRGDVPANEGPLDDGKGDQLQNT